MEIINSFTEIKTDLSQGTCVTWGNFDSVHLGHQELIKTLCNKAQTSGQLSVLITFSPHPLQVISTAPPIITPLPVRLELIAQLGVNLALVLPFTPELAMLEPENFVQQILASALHTKQVFLGHNSFFGKARRGNATLLRQFGKRLGFSVEQLPPVLVDNKPVSSTWVRELLAAGKVKQASLLLGRYHFVQGQVCKGRQLGQTIGFPTLNIKTACASSNDTQQTYPTHNKKFCLAMLPAPGVYAVWAEIQGLKHQAVASIGTNPTFEQSHGPSPLSLEVHVLNYAKNLYGQFVRIHFSEWLRDQQYFSSAEKLSGQIRIDIEKTKKIL